MENDSSEQMVQPKITQPVKEAEVSPPPQEPEKKRFPWVVALIFAVLFIVLGFLSSTSTSDENMAWLRTLKEPPGFPPNWVFGVVWTVLYAMMGFSLTFLLIAAAHAKKEKVKPLFFFAVQLALNLTWTPVFFGAQLKLPALVIILALLAAIFLTIRAFQPISKVAALLLVPYLLWVAYASYLNAGFVFLNL